MVTVRSLHKTWPGGVEALRGIDFDVHPGEVFGLLGPNGAGKSTTIGVLTTAVTPSSGIARVAGVDVAREPRAARAVSGIVFQDSVVDHALTGERNLHTHAALWGVETDAAHGRIADLAARFGLGGIIDRPVRTYSGGQRRRLEIARALVARPQVLFLDEPTVGLDPRIRYELLDLIAGLRHDDELTVLLTTHYLDEAERLCDRIGIIHEGEIVAMGTPPALLASIGDHVVELRAASEHDAAAALARLREHGLADDDALLVGRTLTLPQRGGERRDLATAVERLELPIVASTTRAPHLDDVYLRLTGERIAA
jgi:ABC-2 type transport system ATP-binding protein